MHRNSMGGMGTSDPEPEPLLEQMSEALLASHALRQLRAIESSINRLITQVKASCIDEKIKEGYVDELGEMAFEIHHLSPVTENTPKDSEGMKANLNYYRAIGGKVSETRTQ